MPTEGGAESGALRGSALAEALTLISKLPLSDIEKAEAVRRLLALGGAAASNNKEKHDPFTVNNGK